MKSLITIILLLILIISVTLSNHFFANKTPALPKYFLFPILDISYSWTAVFPLINVTEFLLNLVVFHGHQMSTDLC